MRTLSSTRSRRPHRLARASAAVDSWGFAEGDEIGAGSDAVRLLGGGHRYEAWLAWDEHLRTLVVAKLLRPDQAERPAARRALEAEARHARPAGAPAARALVRRRAGGRAAAARARVRRGAAAVDADPPLRADPSSRSCRSRSTSARSCTTWRRSGVVHLDVKPRNIIMAGSPRLIDLSVARRLDELGALRGHVGTDAYMAPEQCDPERSGSDRPGERRVGPRRDRARGVHRRAAVPAPERRAGTSAARAPAARRRRSAARAPGAAPVVSRAAARRPAHARPSSATRSSPSSTRSRRPGSGASDPAARQLLERLEAS